MQKLAVCLSLALVGCSATLTDQSDGLLQLGMPAPHHADVRHFSQSGTVFVGKLATVSALNSNREFVSDYHGEVRLTLFPNEKIECHWWTEGRIVDETVYEGWNGFVEAFSTLCAGRLQADNSFDFQGAYVPSGATFDSDVAPDEAEKTFSLRGKIEGDRLLGELEMGSVFRNAVVITDIADVPDPGHGVRFEAVRLEESLDGLSE